MALSAPTQAQQQSKQTQNVNSRVAVPLPNPNASAPKPQQKPTAAAAAATIPPQTAQPQSIEDATQAATAAVAAAMAKLGPVNQNQGKAPTDSTDNLTQKVNQMRLQDNQNQRSRGRGRGGAPRGGRRDSAQKAIEVPKEDFDFESSNAKFNKEGLAKEANPASSPVGNPNGDNEDVIPATNGHVNGENEEDVVIPPSEKKYDKKSSFFDNISSDLKDRVEQAKEDGSSFDGRAMRSQERTKNLETFGQGSVDSGYRGGYRGRGRGYGNYRGRGDGNYRGGRGRYDYRGAGYRGRGGRGGQETFV
jgi:protein LSM14